MANGVIVPSNSDQNIPVTMGSGYASVAAMESCKLKGNIVEINLGFTFAASTSKSFTNVFSIPSQYAPRVQMAITANDNTHDRPMAGYLNEQGVCSIYRDASDSIGAIRIHAIYTI